MSNLKDRLYTIYQFIRYRWMLNFTERKNLEAWQHKQLKNFYKKALKKSSFYKNCAINNLSDLPIMDKQSMMENFSARNTAGIKLEQALVVAAQAENSRDFNPTLGDITVGMSSGTSGKRGLFLVSKEERLRWAGILLAKTLPGFLLKQILMPWKPPLRIAFFLRANSNLYNTLNSSSIDFKFYDLLENIDIDSLNNYSPQVLVAPSTVLNRLARAKLDGQLISKPVHIISVAEVLEHKDALLIEKAFDIRPQQIYQATEGFIGYTCERGSLHLNESCMHIEKEWLGEKHNRFYPIITDFSRTTQLIVRYRLNDILRISENPCPCSRAELTIDAIEGRSDEVLWLPSLVTKKPQPIYPDLLRRAMMLVDPAVTEYSIIQNINQLKINFITDGDRKIVQKAISEAIEKLCKELEFPEIVYGVWQSVELSEKRRRIICENTWVEIEKETA